MRISAIGKFFCFTICAWISSQAATFTVSKDGRGTFTTIQAAVNQAGKGDVIEILDAAVYPEQVNIDSTKNGLTLVSSNPTALQKPTITFKDITHVNPKSCVAALDTIPADSNQNFDQNGALRLLRVRNVTIDGIGIDGVAPTPFAWANVWGDGVTCNGNLFPLFAGNGGIAIFVSANVTIRNCDIKNAYFGLALKDRNTGGIFANVNPADLAKTNVVPISGFGKSGGHIIENNRIHNNSWGFYSESSWDLGSTFRFNLVYENHHPSTGFTSTTVKGMTSEGANQPGGAMFFKDVMLSPTSIYNNTFWHNYMNIIGGYRPGAQHLLFNNIFGVPNMYWQSDANFGGVSWMSLDPIFVNRMHNCLYSVQNAAPTPQTQNVQAQQYDTTTKQQVQKDSVVSVFRNVQIMNGMTADATGTLTINLTLKMSSGPVVVPQTITGVTLPGALIVSQTANSPFPASANVRWFDVKYQSTDPTSPLFLTPDWTDSMTNALVKNAGWSAAGIYNSDGKVADIGAIPSVSRPTDNVVIAPLSPVLVNGTAATLNFSLSAVAGNLQAPTIKYVKMVRFKAGYPAAADLGAFGGQAALVLAPPLDVTLSSSNVALGSNTLTATFAPVLAATENYAFFELIAEGKGSNGKTVSTNVGFIPYRKLDYKFLVQVLDATTGNPITTVTAGQTVGLRITPQNLDGTSFPNTITSVSVSLNSGANLYTPPVPPFNIFSLPTITGPTTKTVVFTKVPKGGIEYVTASGTWVDPSNSNKTVFYGVLTGVKILPGPADSVIFQSPPSKIRNPGSAPILDPGILFPGTLAVFDQFGNNVGAQVSVSLKSLNPTIGDITVGNVTGPATVMTDSNGIAAFGAKVTGGAQNQIFTLQATLATNQNTDQADLKVGQPRDKVWILYADTNAVDTSLGITGTVGQRFPVTLRASVNGVTRDTFQSVLNLTLTPGIVAYKSATDTAALTQATLVNGQVVVYITGVSVVSNGSIIATPAVNNLLPGNRAKINFTAPAVVITKAAYYADNGFGNVNRVEIYFADSLTWPPDSLALHWPDLASPVKVVSSGMTWDAANNKHLTVLLASPFPPNITTGNASQQLGTIYTRNPSGAGLPDQASGFAIADSVGPLLDTADVEIKYVAGTDYLDIAFTEKVSPASLAGASLLLIKPGNATPITLTVGQVTALDASGLDFRVSVTSGGAAVPLPGDSLKINAAGPLTDLFANKANPLNRPVVLKLKVSPPPPLAVQSAAYFADNGTGSVNRVEIYLVNDLTVAPDSALLFWPDSAAPPQHASTGITWDPANLKHVTIRLTNSFPAGITAPTSATSPGVLYTHVAVAGAPTQASPLALADSVGPLLDSAVLWEKYGSGPDTIFVSFSEKITSASLSGSSLVLIKQGTRDSIPLTIQHVDSVMGGFKVAVADLGSMAPASGDSLKLNAAGPVSDVYGNLPNPMNRAVEMGFHPVPRPPTLLVTLDKPFFQALGVPNSDFVVLGTKDRMNWVPIQGSQNNVAEDCSRLSSLDCGPTITTDTSGKFLSPTLTLVIDRPIKYKVSLFTNSGSFVSIFSGEITAAQLGVDANNVPIPGAGDFLREPSGSYQVKIAWNGHAQNGQLAGTGAYLARIALNTTILNSDLNQVPIAKVKIVAFGFVRR